MNDGDLYGLARELTHEFFGNKLAIGKRFLYKGRPIEITGGQFMGRYGLSNHWHWTYLDTGESGHGYGGREPIFVELDDD